MKFLLTLLALCLPYICSAQSIPYKVIYPVYEVTQTQLPNDLASIAFKVSHADPTDTREIKMAVNHAKGTIEVPINADGSFELPKLDKDLRETAIVTHNLGKGALNLSFGIHIKAQGSENIESFAAMCAKLKEKFKDVKPEIWDAMAVFEPRFKKCQIVITGVILQVPVKDSITTKLLKQGKVVKAISNKDILDFIVKFSEYDPNTHTAAFHEKDERELKMSIIPEILFHLDKPKEGIVIFKHLSKQ